ncbi:hypothetical protein GUY59_31620 [Nonomuraea sp. K271]|nr:hypothetical protein [Nonomuraea sp. K271]
MQAFVMKEIGQVGLVGKPVPRPGPLDAVVRTTAARWSVLSRSRTRSSMTW